MFTESSEIYDLVYSFKDYQKESQEIKNIIHEHMPACKTVLDVACGTGEHHKFLKDQYQIDGLDLNHIFLEKARQKNPTGAYFHADMTDFDLDKTYDVILCLFSSIGYARTLEKVAGTLNCFRQHLNPGGLVIVETWITPEAFEEGRMDMLTYNQDDYIVCRMNDSSNVGKLSGMKFYFLVGKKNERIRHFEELHELGLFTVEEMKEAFTTANFQVEFDREGFMGRGLYCGKRIQG